MNSINLLLLNVIVVICLLSYSEANPMGQKQEVATEEKCRDLCTHCGCVGFYCGDECICECNNQEDQNVKCVETMQSNCQKLKLPFEVLIQGPSGNRFVRALLLSENDSSMRSESDVGVRKARSTISIYKPEEKNPKNGIESITPNESTTKLENVESKQDVSVLASITKDEPTKKSENCELVNDSLKVKELIKREANPARANAEREIVAAEDEAEEAAEEEGEAVAAESDANAAAAEEEGTAVTATEGEASVGAPRQRLFDRFRARSAAAAIRPRTRTSALRTRVGAILPGLGLSR